MRRVALLVGNSKFNDNSGIANLEFPKADVEGLADLLSHPDIGRFDRVETLVEASKDQILNTLARLLDDERGATVLFYYSGHGKVSDSGRLYLAASNTTERHLPADGVPFAAVIDMKDDYGCSRFFAILDCCYAGLASSVMKGSSDDQLKAFADGRGVFFLGAANATAAAREAQDLGHGVLTAGIILGLQTGKADVSNTGRITGPDLFAWCRNFASARGSVRPVQVNRVMDDDLVIAFSAKKLSPEVIARARAHLTLCWEKRMLSPSDIEALKAYFLDREVVSVPPAASLESDFLEYAQGTIRFDEFLTLRMSERAAGVDEKLSVQKPADSSGAREPRPSPETNPVETCANLADSSSLGRGILSPEQRALARHMLVGALTSAAPYILLSFLLRGAAEFMLLELILGLAIGAVVGAKFLNKSRRNAFVTCIASMFAAHVIVVFYLDGVPGFSFGAVVGWVIFSFILAFITTQALHLTSSWTKFSTEQNGEGRNMEASFFRWIRGLIRMRHNRTSEPR